MITGSLEVEANHPASAVCVHFASNISRVSRSEVLVVQSVTVIEYSPEKAGVGGSTPSLATIIFNGLADQPEISHL
jgi:hypothetical protein